MDKPIEVCQFVLPGNENHGKWYVCRGSGKHASYLCNDGNWYSDTLRGGFSGKPRVKQTLRHSRIGIKKDLVKNRTLSA